MSYVSPERIGDRYAFDAECSWTFEAGVDPAGFHDALAPANELVDDARVVITSDAVTTRTADPANVGMVETGRSCVEDAPGTIAVGVNLNVLVDDLPPYYPDDPLPYSVEIHHDPDGDDTLRVYNTEGEVETDAFSADDVCHDCPEFPEPQDGYNNEVWMPAPKIRGVLGALAETNDYLLQITPEDGSVCFETLSVASSTAGYEWSIEGDVTPGESVRYATDYVGKIARGLHTDGMARVRFGDGQPLEVLAGTSRYALAPRIGPNPDGGDA